MSFVDRISRLGNASRVVIGGAGAIVAIFTLWGRWTILDTSRSVFAAIWAITLMGFGFSLSVLLFELCVWFFERFSPKRKHYGSVPFTGVLKTSYPMKNQAASVETNSGFVAYSRRAPSLSWAAIASLLLLIIALPPCGVLAVAWLNGTNNKKDKETDYATKNEIRQLTEHLNKKLTYLSVTDTNNILTLLNSDGSRLQPPTAQYLISVQDKYVGQISMFRAKEYLMPSDPLRVDPSVRDLCGTIDKTLEEQDEILKALQDAQIKLSLSMSLWGVTDAGIELNPPKVVLVELASILRAFAGLKAKKVEILVKGYADGQRGPWTASLLREPYHYDVVNVYPRAQYDRIDSFQFIKIEKPKHIDDKYSNKDLPELRARFVQENFISKFLQSCSGSAETEVHILEGYADSSNVINEPDRKAQIFINIY